MKRMTLLAVTAASATAIALPALAGNLKAPAPEPQVMPPAPTPVPMATSDWTGGYVGLGLGYDKAKSSPGTSGSSGIGSLYGGYNYDFGKFVVGGELGMSRMHAGYGAGTLQTTYQAKLKGGMDLGRTMVYGALGAAHAEHVHGVGKLIGVGLDYRLTDNILVGAEADYTLYNNGVAAGTDLKNTSLQARVSFKF
jgi:outer membrane immunogenic protein